MSHSRSTTTASNGRSHSTRKPPKKQQQVNGTVPSQDFDFESANAKFNKEQILHSMYKREKDAANNDLKDEVIIPEEPIVYYDKNKSFFDDISCEAKERAEGKKSR